LGSTRGTAEKIVGKFLLEHSLATEKKRKKLFDDETMGELLSTAVDHSSSSLLLLD
jgi:hypothetical protein